jgi:hypothetical protein
MMAAASVQSQGLGYLTFGKHHHDTTSTFRDHNEAKFEKTLPGFPACYTGERVWSGSEMALKQHEWIVILSEQEQLHILNALRFFQSLNVDPGLMSPKTFPLPKDLSDRLRAISHDCYNGRGFCILRGLRPEIFTEEENVLVFAGVSVYVAPIRGFQDLNRELVVCHVISQDTNPEAQEENLRPAFTNGQVSFHTDIGDILTLFTMDVPDTGGETMIVSSSKIYNELAETRPDLLQELAKDWAFLLSQNYDTDGTPLITNVAGDKLVLQYSRLPVTGFRDEGPNPTLPPPTPNRLEAMDMLEDLGRKYSFALPRIPGDIAFINNLCLMHGRNAFDIDANGKPLPSKRHLVKLILRDPKLAWDFPESLSWISKRIYGSNQDNGGRTEKWQVAIGSDKSLPDGKIWVGAGAEGNG